jgi:hypothetical protein
MRLAFLGGSLTLLMATVPSLGQTTKIDLRTKAGVEKVKGQWRYSDV